MFLPFCGPSLSVVEELHEPKQAQSKFSPIKPRNMTARDLQIIKCVQRKVC